MRHAPSPGEYVAWQFLRARRLGASFKRQQIIGGVIVDFLAPKLKLIVEVDGEWHAGRGLADARRDRIPAAAGYRVLRVSEQDVLSALPQVVASIRAAIASS